MCISNKVPGAAAAAVLHMSWRSTTRVPSKFRRLKKWPLVRGDFWSNGNVPYLYWHMVTLVHTFAKLVKRSTSNECILLCINDALIKLT